MTTKQLHQEFLAGSGICTDTRNIVENCFFIALKGANFNGNTFADEAVKKGAYRVVIDDEAFKNEKTILVKDTLTALQELAAFHRKHLKLPILSLTGSNGKTTTKELINAVLSKKYKTIATQGNLNNHIGVPLTLLSMTSETEMGIVEMGANHLHEIENLCQIAQPDYGYITNFGKAHLEGFGSLEGVVKGKSELYTHLKDHDKTVFVNGAETKQLELTKTMNRVVFNETIIQLMDASNEVKVKFKNTEIQSKLVGLYNFNNIAAAIAIGDYFNVPEEQIKTAIEGYIPQNNRSQRLEKAGHKILLDAYNANPTSMMAALENFKQAEGNRKILILGDMFEMGSEAEKEHQHIVDFLEQNPFGKAYLVGSNFNKTKTKASHIKTFESFDDFKKQFKAKDFKNCFFLIKGSRGMALERVLNLL
ncbi:UDP-N-acetylmuramoyl-tripeptide--D-alanyl-D-alanine ligase [Marixanthomonas spongiae]|uniref:UDP-N-acetylmuramoyl-tripeptide--D-alanyl-D-alanine ligase n=1 Tax=Marixanthomonas spongiae TaxID=2174845 RepID=A0A2U0HX33_9FLAO|nr:UDP-N-acetylmuramoyl-tripeptide--D-alanyl-D-alanine ligase [Marixanthomonas spongiae]PVW13300.1 UDP-N-acetylmuramoyl-tripeptide--D-alanyl-D-alanine ligase [Marixanthomonas spongiae]